MILDGLYEILKSDNESASVKLSDSEHPIFKAHFPSKPILPGFIHLEIISEIFNVEINSIKKAKFIDIVLPEQTLHYKRVGNRYSVLFQEKEVASFSL